MKLFKDPVSRFETKTAFKVMLPPIISIIVMFFHIDSFVKSSYAFFVSQGFDQASILKEAFYEHLYGSVLDYSIYLGLFLIAIFFIGFFLSRLILRPFSSINAYVEKIHTEKDVDFKFDLLGGLDYLVSFGQVFFSYLKSHRAGRKNDHFISEKYLSIDGPKFNPLFFVHYFVLLIIITSVAYYGIHLFVTDLFDSMADLAVQTLTGKSSAINTFFQINHEVINNIDILVLSIMIILYLIQSLNFTEKINGVAYRYFHTMREIMKGNDKARIFLRYDDPTKDSAECFNHLMDTLFKKGP